MRRTQPRLVVICGRFEPSFDISEPTAYGRAVSDAEVHVHDTGHFAPDTAGDEIAQLVRAFLGVGRSS